MTSTNSAGHRLDRKCPGLPGHRPAGTSGLSRRRQRSFCPRAFVWADTSVRTTRSGSRAAIEVSATDTPIVIVEWSARLVAEDGSEPACP